MENASQNGSVILIFMTPLWPIAPPLSMATSTGVWRTAGTLTTISDSLATSPGEGRRGCTLTRQLAAGQGGASGMGTPDVRTGPGFHSARAAGAQTSSRKHESVGHPLWWSTPARPAHSEELGKERAGAQCQSHRKDEEQVHEPC